MGENAVDTTQSWLQRMVGCMHNLQDVWSMGSDFYKTLAIVCLYGLGHINEVRKTCEFARRCVLAKSAA